MTDVTVRQALQRFAANPQRERDPIDTPVHLLIAEQLFTIANSPDPTVRGSMAKSTRAQKMIFDRMSGKRRSGSRPATAVQESLDFVDLTEIKELKL